MEHYYGNINTHTRKLIPDSYYIVTTRWQCVKLLLEDIDDKGILVTDLISNSRDSRLENSLEHTVMIALSIFFVTVTFGMCQRRIQYANL